MDTVIEEAKKFYLEQGCHGNFDGLVWSGNNSKFRLYQSIYD